VIWQLDITPDSRLNFTYYQEINMDSDTRARWMAARTKHGAYIGGVESAEHYTWRAMVSRCKNPNHPMYRYYGGKGVKVCDRWLDFSNFLEDMGHRPGDWASLDRIDSNGDYTPDNCRWATKSEQQKNKTSTKIYTDGTFTGTLVECAAKLGLSKELAFWRWKKWGTFEKDREWQKLPSVK
jgi:hypothetical protein